MEESGNDLRDSKVKSIVYSIKHMNDDGMNYFFAALALLSTIIGGGIAGLPFSFYKTGFSLGIIANIFMAIQCGLSCYLYFQTKDILNGLSSISEISYKLLGRGSIFFTNIALIFLTLGLLVLYFILFGTTFSALMVMIFRDTKDTSSFVFDPKFYVLIIAFINIFAIYKKEIHELQLLSVLLFLSIVVLTLVCFIYLGIEGTS